MHCKFIKLSAAAVDYRGNTLAVDLKSIWCLATPSRITLKHSNTRSVMTKRRKPWSSQYAKNSALLRRSISASRIPASSKATSRASTSLPTRRTRQSTALERRTWNLHTPDRYVSDARRRYKKLTRQGLSVFRRAGYESKVPHVCCCASVILVCLQHASQTHFPATAVQEVGCVRDHSPDVHLCKTNTCSFH